MSAYSVGHSGDERDIQGITMQILNGAWTFVRAHPTNTICTILLTVGIGVAGWNALYGQQNIHPAPFWGQTETQSQSRTADTATPPATVPPAPVQRSVQTQPVPATDNAPTSSISTSSAPQTAIPAEVTGNPTTFHIQKNLATLGIFKEKVDGYYGPKTATAIRAFEAQYGLESTGAVSEELLTKLENTVRSGQTAAPAQTSNADPLAQIAMSAADDSTASAPQSFSRDYVIKIQKGLYSLGFLQGAIDGVPGAQTERAIRQFEVFNNYRETGEITPELYDMLLAANASFE
ncbi:peptidoglycan-binding domain-containing protein [Maritalea sp. S77]|uniref:peptidoglycan-binding domain-containing protein n=1 Tax=Maritalea sp. S77 TaxID=3415125 RepID=UPI003C7DE23A